MKNKIDLGKLQDNLSAIIGKASETPLEVAARLDLEKAAAKSKRFRGYVELALSCALFAACLWKGVIDTSDPKVAEWARAGLLAIIGFVAGRQVGKFEGKES